MALSDPDDFSRYDDFDIFKTSYKVVSDHPIEVNVLVPKDLTSDDASLEPHPVLLRFHGGGLVGASALFPAFFGQWHFELAARHSAIIVSPEYRLIPEASIDDLLEDVEDVWTWVKDKLPDFVLEKTEGKVRTDTSRVLLTGESAGGYISLLLGLNHPDEISSIAAAYPMVDMKSSYFTEASTTQLLGAPQYPYSLIEEHTEKIKSGAAPAVVSSDPKFDRSALMFAYFQHGEFKNVTPADRTDIFILDKLNDGARFPAGGVFVWHGKNDSLVPAEGTEKLAALMSEVDPDAKFYVELREDQEHGFDGDTSIDEDWFAEGLKDVVISWLD